jgi:hypothetical protein
MVGSILLILGSALLLVVGIGDYINSKPCSGTYQNTQTTQQSRLKSVYNIAIGSKGNGESTPPNDGQESPPAPDMVEKDQPSSDIPESRDWRTIIGVGYLISIICIISAVVLL